MTGPHHSRILFIDAYDSFTNNIVSLLETSLNAEVTVIKIDTVLVDFVAFLRPYDAVIAGPGPGDPRKAKDVGLFQRLWDLDDDDLIPVLGVCLGFQNLVLAFGGTIQRLPEPRHGIVRTVRSNGVSIFEGILLLDTVQYHSLHATVDFGQPEKSTIKLGGESDIIYGDSDLIPLAWDCAVDNSVLHEPASTSSNLSGLTNLETNHHDARMNPLLAIRQSSISFQEPELPTQQLPVGETNTERVLMAVKHKIKPFYGIQFHPESISSGQGARQVIANWWTEACAWNERNPRRVPAIVKGLSNMSDMSLDKSARGNGTVNISNTSLSGSVTNHLTASVFNGSSTVESVSLNGTDLKPSNAVQPPPATGGVSNGVPNGFNSKETWLFKRTMSNGADIMEPSISTKTHINRAKALESGPPKRMTSESKQTLSVASKIISLADLTVPKICEAMGLTQREVMIFDSENHQKAETGAYSIIGIINAESIRFEYNIESSEICQIAAGIRSTHRFQHPPFSVFEFLNRFMRDHAAVHGRREIPFWGGLMGYITYEACLETLGILKSSQEHPQSSDASTNTRPDLGFVYVERSVVIDHFRHKVHIQSIKPDDYEWVSSTSLLLSSPPPTGGFAVLAGTAGPRGFLPNKPQCKSEIRERQSAFVDTPSARIVLPDEAEYKSKIRACQSAIRAGESYELCLTNQVDIRTSSRFASWPLYCRLRTVNPAPFGAYIRLGNLSFLSSSPERFVRWSRPSAVSGASANGPMSPECLPEGDVQLSHPSVASDASTGGSVSPQAMSSTFQFRPIKGTIARKPTPSARPLTLVEATKLLSTPKEQAENLMIVDLIRHDLHGVVGSGRVTVPKLMVVEEYETVFQLVSVIEGRMAIGPESARPDHPHIQNGESGDGDTRRQKIFSHSDINGATYSLTNADHGGEHLLPSQGNTPSSSATSSSSPSPYPSSANSSGASQDEPSLSISHDHLLSTSTQSTSSSTTSSCPSPPSPFSALPATLPPGSMTGAPKLRSCQILRNIESRPRGVYSGVVGYMDVGGGGDWSVAIRCAVRWDEAGISGASSSADMDAGHDGHGEPAEEDTRISDSDRRHHQHQSGDTWTVGAGGAVTALSTEDGEWKEMLAKLQATLRVFEWDS